MNLGCCTFGSVFCNVFHKVCHRFCSNTTHKHSLNELTLLYVWVVLKTSKPQHLLTDGCQWWTTSQAWSQIAFRHWTEVGWWSHSQQILPALSQHLANMAIGCMISRFCHCWANVGPTKACQPKLRLLWLGQRWANVGFLFKMTARNNRGFWDT